MSPRETVKYYLKILGHALGRSLHDRLDHTDHQLDLVIDQNNRNAQVQTALLESSIHLVDALKALRKMIEEEMVRQVCLETDDYGFTNPETGLISHLYSFLDHHAVLDVGAHTGDVSERMLETGYEVYAFEPYPPVFEKLAGRLGGNEKFHAFNYALGSEPKGEVLHVAKDLSGANRYDDATVFSSLYEHAMPDDLPFTDAVTVPVWTLADLHREGAIPADIGLVKIDTEGYDLEVIRGMEEKRYPVVAAEYWDVKIPFARSGLLYTLASMVAEMKQRGYKWFLVLYRVWGRNQTAFYANHARPVPNSWGNIFFFRNYELFTRARQWCAAVLPRTYFRSTPPPEEAVAAHRNPAGGPAPDSGQHGSEGAGDCGDRIQL